MVDRCTSGTYHTTLQDVGGANGRPWRQYHILDRSLHHITHHGRGRDGGVIASNCSLYLRFSAA